MEENKSWKRGRSGVHLRLNGHSLDMTQGAIGPILLQFSLPLLFGSMFQLLYNTVDSMVVGNFVGKGRRQRYYADL